MPWHLSFSAYDGWPGSVGFNYEEGHRYSVVDMIKFDKEPMAAHYRLRQVGPKVEYPAIFSMLNGGFFICDRRFRDLVEIFEPNVHFFAPVSILYDDGSRSEGEYFRFQCGNVLLDAIDFEVSDVRKYFEKTPSGRMARRIGRLRSPTRLAWHRDAIGDKSLWMEDGLKVALVVSDAFQKELKARGMNTGYQAQESILT